MGHLRRLVRVEQRWKRSVAESSQFLHRLYYDGPDILLTRNYSSWNCSRLHLLLVGRNRSARLHEISRGVYGHQPSLLTQAGTYSMFYTGTSWQEGCCQALVRNLLICEAQCRLNAYELRHLLIVRTIYGKYSVWFLFTSCVCWLVNELL